MSRQLELSSWLEWGDEREAGVRGVRWSCGDAATAVREKRHTVAHGLTRLQVQVATANCHDSVLVIISIQSNAEVASFPTRFSSITFHPSPLVRAGSPDMPDASMSHFLRNRCMAKNPASPSPMNVKVDDSGTTNPSDKAG